MNEGWKVRVVELRERAQIATERADMAFVASQCESEVDALEKDRSELVRLSYEIALAQAQLRAEGMRLRDRLKGQPTTPVKLNGAAE